jgi:death-on-curing protein
MTLYSTVDMIRSLHRHIISTSGGSNGILHLEALESAVSQPQTTFGGEEMYAKLVDKAAAIGFSLIRNHVFVDGNKRVGHGAMDLLLRLNGFRLSADVDEQERVVLGVAASTVTQEEFFAWVQAHVVPLDDEDDKP